MTTEDRAAEREAVSSRAASRGGRLSGTVGVVSMLLCATVLVVFVRSTLFFVCLVEEL